MWTKRTLGNITALLAEGALLGVAIGLLCLALWFAWWKLIELVAVIWE